MIDPNKTTADSSPESRDRRKIIKKLAVGASVIVGYSVLPDKWIRPVVGQFVLPAHAVTSGVLEAVETAAEPTTQESAEEYNTTEVYSLGSTSGNNKLYTWLNKTGAEYGGKIKFDFGSCGELIVPDASRSHGADGTTSNHNQAIYFCGTDFPVGSKENNNGKASVFTPPNCKSSSVTLYYNK